MWTTLQVPSRLGQQLTCSTNFAKLPVRFWIPHSTLELRMLSSTAACDCAPLQPGTDEVRKHTDAGHPSPSLHGEHAHKSERVVSCMTLGAVAFQMSLFYIVNHRDDDIRRYSLSVIGQTISIFCSILTFSAIYGVIESYLTHVDSTTHALLSPALCIFFLLVLMIMVMFGARVRGERAEKKASVGVSKKMHKRQMLDVPEHELNAKTFGASAAQMCAAATMRGFGHLQFIAYARQESTGMLCALCAAVFFGLFSIVYIVSGLRKCVILADGVIDDAEITWIRVAEECEDEVIALCTGFHSAVAVRAIITGTLPHVLLHGYEHQQSLEVAEVKDISILFGVALLCACLCIALNMMFFGLLNHGVNLETLRSDIVSRVFRVATQSIGLMFAWCMCFGTHLFALHLEIAKSGLELRLVLALLQSFSCFLVVLVLDFIADQKWFGPAFEKAIVMMIFALGASVGLAWEHAFHLCADVAVDSLSEAQSNPVFRHLCALGLSVAIVLTVFPAYRFYIVPRMFALLEEHQRELEEQESEYRRSMRSSSLSEFIGPGEISENIFVWHGDSKLDTDSTGPSPTPCSYHQPPIW